MRARFILTICSLLAITASAQNNAHSEPPYMAHSSNFVMTLFNLKPEDVQEFLPAGIKANVNDTGMVTGGLEIYETDRIQGTPNYGMVFIFVEVANLESNNGTPGHWAIWGRLNQESTLKNMQHYFNFPYQLDKIEVTQEESIYTGTVGNGLISLKIKYNEKAPFGGEGIVNMYSLSKDGKILKTEVPWFSTGCAGNLIALDIDPQGDSVLNLVKTCKPYFSIISTSQTFSYSRPGHGGVGLGMR
jgi:hypothetical protein